MMSSHFSDSDLENLWENLLSREPDRVQRAYSTLAEADRSAVMTHLERMVNEPGWHPEQRRSALVALETLGKAPGGSRSGAPGGDSTSH